MRGKIRRLEQPVAYLELITICFESGETFEILNRYQSELLVLFIVSDVVLHRSVICYNKTNETQQSKTSGGRQCGGSECAQRKAPSLCTLLEVNRVRCFFFSFKDSECIDSPTEYS